MKMAERNALTCYKDAHGEWWCDCYVLGNAQAIGLQCGKGGRK